MKEKIYDARTGMEYVLVGDYYLPALKLPRTRPVGRWGMLHKAYLKLRKPAYYQSLLLSGKLDTVLANVEEQAAERYEVLIEQMSQRESISEKLKEENQMEWVRLWGDRIFEKCGIRRDEGGDGGKTLEIRGKRRLSARDGGANYQQS